MPEVVPDEYIKYRGTHLIDKGVIEQYEFQVPYAEDPSGVITYYTKSVAKAGGVERIAGAFATLAPMVRDYLQERVFERPVDLDDKVVLRRLAENDAQQLVLGAFQQVIRDLSIEEREATIEERAVRVSDTWRFAQFLDRATDVAAFAKLTMNSRFALEYISTTGALRYYYPDFIARLADDTCLVIETKGLEDLDVALKDRRARRWCRDAAELSGRDWAYEKVRQRVFDAYTADDVDGLRRFIAAGTGASEDSA